MFNTVFYRLLISYILLIVSAILVGATSYTYFSSRFNEEIEDVNNLILNNISRSIGENIIEKVSKLCIDITMDQRKNDDLLYYFRHQDVEKDNIRIQKIRTGLKELILINADIIDSISVYYRDNHFVVGSSGGVTFLNNNTDPFSDSDWMKTMLERNSSYIWLDNSVFPSEIFGINSDDMLTYIYLFADNSNGPGYKGFIKVNVSKSTFQGKIQEYLPEDSSMSFIADGGGNVICNFGNPGLFYPADFSRQIKPLPLIYENMPSESFITKIGNANSVVSYRSLEYTGWNLINVIPLDKYYKKTIAIKRTMLAICAVSIMIGLLISAVFTSKIYNPVRSIIKRISLLGNRERSYSHGENEYAYMNDFIDNLSIKVNELETTLETNLPLIKYNLVQDIIYKNIENIHDVEEQFKLANLSMPYRYYYLSVITLDQEALNYANTENTQFIKYNLVDYIEKCTDLKGKFISAAISKNEFVIIANSDNDNPEFLIKILNKIIEYVYENFKINSYSVIGGKTSDMMELHQRFKECKNLQKYNFFYPEIKILTGGCISGQNDYKEIPEKLSEDIAVTLNNRDLEGLSKLLDKFSDLTRSGYVPQDHSHQKILELVYVLSRYMKEIGVAAFDGTTAGRFSEYKKVSNINQFKKWFVSVAGCTFEAVCARERNQRHDMLKRINEYVIANIDKDLSMSYVAEMVGLSPNYLSRVYREETGYNFINFVTNEKMNRAKELARILQLTKYPRSLVTEARPTL